MEINKRADRMYLIHKMMVSEGIKHSMMMNVIDNGREERFGCHIHFNHYYGSCYIFVEDNGEYHLNYRDEYDEDGKSVVDWIASYTDSEKEVMELVHRLLK